MFAFHKEVVEVVVGREEETLVFFTSLCACSCVSKHPKKSPGKKTQVHLLALLVRCKEKNLHRKYFLHRHYFLPTTTGTSTRAALAVHAPSRHKSSGRRSEACQCTK